MSLERIAGRLYAQWRERFGDGCAACPHWEGLPRPSFQTPKTAENYRLAEVRFNRINSVREQRREIALRLLEARLRGGGADMMLSSVEEDVKLALLYADALILAADE